MPDEEWHEHQLTPLCTKCDAKFGLCHFCRGQAWCVPKTTDPAAAVRAEATALADAFEAMRQPRREGEGEGAGRLGT